MTPQTLSNYLISMSQLDSTDANSSRQSNAGESYEENESDDEADSILPDIPSNNTNVFKNLVATTQPSTTSSSSSGNNSVLANCPDITIVKKEKPENKVNNNSDHSESGSDKGN